MGMFHDLSVVPTLHPLLSIRDHLISGSEPSGSLLKVNMRLCCGEETSPDHCYCTRFGSHLCVCVLFTVKDNCVTIEPVDISDVYSIS